MSTVGYLVPEFPSQTHAFFWREIEALEAQGMALRLFSTKRPPRDACQHAFAEAARMRTTYLHPPEPRVAATALRHAPSMPSLAAYVAGLSDSSPAERAKVGALAVSALQLVRTCEKQNIEHVHAHSCASAAHILAMAKRIGGPTYSLTLHGDLDVYGKDHRSKMADASFVGSVTRPLQQSIIEQVGLSEDRVPIIPMGVNTDRFLPRDDRLPKPPDGPLQLITVARLNPVKGHVHAFAAMARACEARVRMTYVIAGEGPHREELERTVGELGLESAVTFTGTIGEDEVLAHLQASDIFVLTSFGKGEAAPVSVMEAMSVGLPVICSKIGGTQDMIESEVDGILVDQKAEDQIFDALMRLGRDAELRARIGRRARERAIRDFDYRQTSARLHRAIRERH